MTEQQGNMPDNVSGLKSKAEEEPIAAFLGMRLLELSKGYAKVSMKMRPEYTNFNGLIFGGIIMAVVDQAFAFATNSLIQPNVASQFNFHYITGAAVGDELTAECQVIKSGKRVCIAEMTLTNQEGKLVAKATGTTIPLA